MIGSIYIIRNNINNKVYIGQTIKHIDKRFKEHISDAFRIDIETNEFVKDTKFYRAIRKYGRDNFYVELLEQCNIEELSNKEIEYIKKYDSYHNGYNSTLGGDGTTTISMSESDKINIVNDYTSGKSINKIALELNVSTSVVYNILTSMGHELRHDVPVGKEVIMYDAYYNPERHFRSKKIAYLYISETTECRFADFWRLMKKSCETGTIAYGHRWQLASDLIYEDKIFRTKFDKEAYIQGKPAYQPEGKQYWVVDGVLEQLFGKRSIFNETIYKCKICGSIISNQTKSSLCASCANVLAKGKLPKPSKNQLIADSVTMNKQQIADKYGRTKSTICYWFKQYNV